MYRAVQAYKHLCMDEGQDQKGEGAAGEEREEET